MRRYRIIYTEAARADIIDIGETIREVAGDAVAGRFIGRLIDTAESLEFMPARHRVRSELSAEIRVIALRKYLIFYKVGVEHVAIIRALHGARDITARLFRD